MVRGKPLPRELAVFHAEVCQAIGGTTRIAILYELAEGQRNVTQLVEALDCPQPTVSRHLKTLRERGMVYAERAGGHVVYTLTDLRVIDALDTLREVMAGVLAERERLAIVMREGTVIRET
jgi:ArsR family transcriptional regulator